MKKIFTPFLFLFALLSSTDAQMIKKFDIPSGIEKIFSLSISNFGNIIAVEYQKNGKSYLQLNNKTYGPYDDISQKTFSKDGNKLGFVYRDGAKEVFQVNDKVIGTFENIDKFILSADGLITAIQFTKNDKSFVSVNGKEYGPFDKVKDLFLSNDGKKFGFIYTISDSIKYVRINDKILGPFIYDRLYLSTSKDYSNVGFSYKKDGKEFIWVNENTFGPLSGLSNPKFSDDGKKYAYHFLDGKQRFIQLNDKIVGPVARSLVSWQISEDGNKYCYVIVKDKKEYIQYMNDTFGPFEGDLRDLRISPDGSTWGIRYDKGDDIYIQIGSEIKLGPFSSVANPVFAPKGSSFSFYFKKNDKWYVQIDKDVFGPVDDGTEVSFSPDGKKYYLKYTIGNDEYFKTNNYTYGPYFLLDYNIAPNGSVFIAYIKLDENKVFVENTR